MLKTNNKWIWILFWIEIRSGGNIKDHDVINTIEIEKKMKNLPFSNFRVIIALYVACGTESLFSLVFDKDEMPSEI